MKLLFVCAFVPVLLAGPTKSRDPAFGRVPFDQWLAEGGQGRMRWSASVAPVQLSVHQRWMTQVNVQMDGAELAKRRGRGQLVIFFQITDREGTRYQDHGSIDLEKIEEGIKQQDIVYTESAFILPGDYDIALAVYNTGTEEHGTKRLTLRVPQLKSDPLPDAWRNLPPVEWVSQAAPPDRWYQPGISGKLNVAMQPTHPVQIEVLVNLSPSERLSGSGRVQDRNLGVLIPALKIFTEADYRNAALDVALLDLTRRRVVFHQENVHGLDWESMKESLTGANPGTIDVAALSNRSQNAAFFVREVRKRIGHGEKPSRVIIVLSSPVAFENGVDLEPIQLEDFPGVPVYYFRMHPPVAPMAIARPFVGPGGMRRGGLDTRGMRRPRGPFEGAGQVDQLEPTLKPLGPRLFDIESPAQFRKALGAVVEEISRM